MTMAKVRLTLMKKTHKMGRIRRDINVSERYGFQAVFHFHAKTLIGRGVLNIVNES